MTTRLSILVALLAALLVAAPAHAADAPFSLRYAETLGGNLSAVGNTLMSCPTGASNCAAARSGSAYSNNDFTMGYVDVDGDSPVERVTSSTNAPSP
jgi:curli biogenesis system outer membrane secretion channel CsgG